jgi:S1-C subfamily serine protease
MFRYALLAASLCIGGSLGADDSLGVEGDAIMKPLARVRTEAAAGSGVLIYSEDREKEGEFRTFVVTNSHVIDDAVKVVKKWDSLRQAWTYSEENDQVTVELFTYLRDGKTVLAQPIKATIIAHDAEEDLAVLELDCPLEVKAVARLLPDGTPLRMLQAVWAVGCSLGVDPIVSVGQITDLEVLIDRRDYIMASANIIFGNSGGGVFTRIGDDYFFIGTPSRISVARNGQAITSMGYFIPAARVRAFFAAQKLEFLTNPAITPADALKEREEMQRRTRQYEAGEQQGPPAPGEP